MRKDGQVILAGVVSYPSAMKDVDLNSKNFKRWIKLNHRFLKNKYGSQYKSLVFHSDEGFPHCHFYVVPDLTSEGHLDIGSIHEGVRARGNLETSATAKEKMRAYKDAMRKFQEEYYESVGIPCGLTKEGPRKRRLTRQQWKLEKSASIRLAKVLKQTVKQRQALRASHNYSPAIPLEKAQNNNNYTEYSK
nr:plasmid recombination protein [Vibrio tasmaniensis]